MCNVEVTSPNNFPNSEEQKHGKGLKGIQDKQANLAIQLA